MTRLEKLLNIVDGNEEKRDFLKDVVIAFLADTELAHDIQKLDAFNVPLDFTFEITDWQEHTFETVPADWYKTGDRALLLKAMREEFSFAMWAVFIANFAGNALLDTYGWELPPRPVLGIE
ncbi:hypothetical protein [Ruegeria lacuscaerulensis]|uniref:hypothetical protein n=1 Tax=Ruegeria lacuscaerulensis TaxID=55218 RepID=UPI0014803D03|nr:hypothetical protein [Ruegeria lacuscaerulensis]